MKRIKNEAGNKYHMLTVVSYAGKAKKGNRGVAAWLCKCECGNETVVYGTHLRNGNTKSCGCLQRRVSSDTAVARTAHGHNKRGSRTSTYRAWHNMKNRCTNSKVQRYSDYGGRGITVCDRWMMFENFLADMGEKPEGLELDRKDNDKGYSKGNCRWATRIEQCANRRSNVFVEYNGERLTISQLAERTGICASTITYRLRTRKMSVDDAVTVPLRGRVGQQL